MKTAVKRIAWMLALALLLPGCSAGTQPREDAGRTEVAVPTVPDVPVEAETEDPYEKDSLPDDLDFGGQTLRIGLYSTQGAAVAPEEETGDILNDAVFQRNARVTERLNVKIELSPHTCEWPDYRQLVLNAITAGTGDYDAWHLWQYDFANTVSQNYWLDLQDAPYLDYAKPWWATDYMEEMGIDGKAKYFLLGDVNYGFLANAGCIFFNKSLTEQYGIPADDIYQMVLEGEWTFENFREIAKKIYTDVNGNEHAVYSNLLQVVAGK